ncbi:MAG: TraR/DksA family transcriptional regulator [Bacteroidetes bacterium]|nr:TraR/DksA family transcriptional regulator [Bacteroidota bacterium]
MKQTVKPYFANRDFTKVAKPQVKVLSSTDNRNRYSDEELQEFKELISGKLEIARGELKYLQEQISRSSEMGDDSDARFKGLEDGTSTSEREYLSQMASRQIQYIGHLEKAMIRIENKTYGICRETGKLISKERLRAVPHATLSIEAKQGKG